MKDILEGGPWILAHRGDHRRARENTLEAFRLSRGTVDGVEFDVRVTRDGVPVIHHDAAFRSRGRRRRISVTPASRLPAWIPRLEAALSAVRPLLVDVEVKVPGHEESLATVLNGGAPVGRTLVSSFFPDILYQLGGAGLRHPIGFLTKEPSLEAIRIGREAGAKVVVVPARALDEHVAALARNEAMTVWTWGANTVHLARANLARGARAIITDAPDQARAALQGPAPGEPPRTPLRTGRPGTTGRGGQAVRG